MFWFWRWDIWNNPGAFLWGFFIGYFFLVVALYAYVTLALIRLARKTKTRDEWLAWIPIANFYLLTQMARKSGHLTWTLLLSFIPFLSLIPLAVGIWLFWIVAEKIRYPGWLSLFLMIPVVNLVVLGIMAWKKK